jgi:hypothetical protein
MSRLESRLTVLAEKVENLSKSIDEAEQYSYAYNVKMLGIPEFSSNETAAETRQLSLLAEFSICAGKRRRRDLCLDLTLPQSMIVDESNQFVKQVQKPV